MRHMHASVEIWIRDPTIEVGHDCLPIVISVILILLPSNPL
jgi:hypothetical protein